MPSARFHEQENRSSRKQIWNSFLGETMGASSVTGTGVGASNKLTSKEMASLANGPSILIAGAIEATETITSPPTSGNYVVFPEALPGGAENYIVILTTQNAGNAYVTDMNEDGSGNFSGFDFFVEADGTVMYLVVKIGVKPKV
jgi:hypothetical protein